MGTFFCNGIKKWSSRAPCAKPLLNDRIPHTFLVQNAKSVFFVKSHFLSQKWFLMKINFLVENAISDLKKDQKRQSTQWNEHRSLPRCIFETKITFSWKNHFWGPKVTFCLKSRKWQKIDSGLQNALNSIRIIKDLRQGGGTGNPHFYWKVTFS